MAVSSRIEDDAYLRKLFIELWARLGVESWRSQRLVKHIREDVDLQVVALVMFFTVNSRLLSEEWKTRKQN